MPEDTIDLLYLGYYLSYDGTEGKHKWQEVSGLPNQGENFEIQEEDVRIYFNPKGKKFDHNLVDASAGQIWRFSVVNNDKKTLYIQSARFVGNWENRAQTTEWRAISFATKKHLIAYDESKIEKFLDDLEPLREAYRKSVGRAKSFLLAQIVKFITS